MRLALGAAAGLAGTVILEVIRRTDEKLIPDSSPPMKEDPGKFMFHKAKQVLPEPLRHRVPEKTEAVVAKLLPLGYGMTFGGLYSTARPQAKLALVEGLMLGLFAWAVGWLGWLPRTGLMPPLSEHKPRQIIRPVAEHALFGLATVASYRYMAAKADVA